MSPFFLNWVISWWTDMCENGLYVLQSRMEVGMSEDTQRRRFVYLLLNCCFAAIVLFEANARDFLVSYECGSDRLCTLVRVEHETMLSQPYRPAGVVVGVIDDDGFQRSDTVSQSGKKTCRKEVRVPEEVHRAILKMFDHISKRGGSNALPPQLTSSEQTMLLFYNTILQQTMNSQCSN